jgi:hypothetical protein
MAGVTPLLRRQPSRGCHRDWDRASESRSDASLPSRPSSLSLFLSLSVSLPLPLCLWRISGLQAALPRKSRPRTLDVSAIPLWPRRDINCAAASATPPCRLGRHGRASESAGPPARAEPSEPRFGRPAAPSQPRRVAARGSAPEPPHSEPLGPAQRRSPPPPSNHSPFTHWAHRRTPHVDFASATGSS